jgi:transcriptional regulator of arginine metabolism
MRYTRQDKIIELIAREEIDTQEKLAELLKIGGFDVTQATVSRDIKELQLVKALAPSGRYKYALPGNAAHRSADRYVKIFKDTVRTVGRSGNMIVVKTMGGCANAACEAIDSLDFPHILGSLAGDNTVFLVVDDAKHAPSVCERFDAMMER